MARRDIYDFMTGIEKLLFSTVVLTLTGMAIAQILLTDESWRNYLNFASRLESQKIVINNFPQTEVPASASIQNLGSVTLELQRYEMLPHAYVLVNGKETKKFLTKTVSVPVRNGDILEIDGTYYKKPFDVIIKEATDNIQNPKKNKKITVNQDITLVSEVKLLR